MRRTADSLSSGSTSAGPMSVITTRRGLSWGSSICEHAHVAATASAHVIRIWKRLLSNDIELDVSNYVLVALYRCLELAGFLDLRNGNSLLVNLDACCGKGVDNLRCGY